MLRRRTITTSKFLLFTTATRFTSVEAQSYASDTASKHNVVSAEYAFLKKCPPLAAGPALLCWEYYDRLLKKSAADEKRVSDGEATALSVTWHQLYSADLELSEAIAPKIQQLRDSVELSNDTDADIKEMAEEDCKRIGQELEEFFEKVQKTVSRTLSRLDVIGSVSQEWILGTTGRAGGTEAQIFADELANMYIMYGESRGWRIQDVTEKDEDAPDSKVEHRLRIRGDDIYRFLRYEIGTHRVQRIPSTEASGRIQTSTASVSLLPIPDAVSVNVRKEDCDIQLVRGSGPGGQGMQSSSNCARVHHRPSGIRKKCHVNRSGSANVEMCLSWIAQDIWAAEQKKNQESTDSVFASQFTSGERSDKIRTYNGPQNRVTDHRLKKDYYYSTVFSEPEQLTALHDEMADRNDSLNLHKSLSDLIKEDFPAAS